MVERFDAVGQLHQTDSRSQGLCADQPGHSPAVPPFEGLLQWLSHCRPELQPSGQVACLLTVLRHHPLHRPARGGQELPDHAEAMEARSTSTEVTSDEDRHGDAPKVLVVRFGV